MALNEDTRNKGVELTLEVKGNHGWSGNVGVSYSNPMFFDSDKPADGWKRSYGRLQINGGLSYQKDKWLVSFQGTYLGDRVLESYQTAVRPYFMTTLYARYHVAKDGYVFLSVDNVFNREDITSHVLSRYNAMPINYRLGYNYKF